MNADQKEFLEWVDKDFPITYKPNDRKHPLFNQWFQIAKGTRDPNYVLRRTILKDGTVREHKPWDKYGAFGITMFAPWYTFAQFAKEVGPKFPKPVAGVPKSFQTMCIDRYDRRGPFNMSNIMFTFRNELPVDRRNRVRVVTPFLDKDGEPMTMTLRELRDYLALNKGKPFPPGVGPFKQRRRVWDESAGRFGRMETIEVELDTIEAVSMPELKRRVRKGLTGPKLVAPPRPWGKYRSEEE